MIKTLKRKQPIILDDIVENFWKIYTASYIIVIILVTLWILRWY